MATQKSGKWVRCAWQPCNKSLYRIPSRVHKYNFCNQKHRVLFAKSSLNKDFGKGWHHTPEEIEKIRQANLARDYNKVFTKETRKKLADNARNQVWTKTSREKLRKANLGKKLTEETKEKIKQSAPRGWKNKAWRGRYSSYAAKHIWAKKYYDGPWVCNYADRDFGVCDGRLELSNMDHKYRKNIKDWQVLCKFHHDLYDYRHGIRGITEKTRNMYIKFGPTQLRDLTIDGIIVETPRTTPYNAI